VVNEMIYDPNGSNNSSLLSLVAGTISFVAGETAKHGDMKVDTPVATMGIRGTAVLVEIDFDVPGQNGTPSANFQVLVEPDGTTGSYILFDKNTLAPLATVNTAGTLTKISQGIVSFEAGSPLTSDQQKLITDLFTTKFGDSNTKSLFDHFTDSIVPQSLQPIYLPGVTLTPVVLLATNTLAPAPAAPSGPTSGVAHTHIAPHVTIFDQSFGENPGDTGSPIPHTLSAPITFTDPNSGDRPTVTVAFASFTYQDGHGHDISASLTAQEQAAVAAVEGISLQTAAGNDNNGSAVWTYSFPDGAFDFLGAGETLTLSYTASVNNNYASDPLTGTATFTITITGTNDVPVITSNVPQTIAFVGGIHTPGGDLTAHVPTSGTIAFDDPDLTDTHTVAVHLLTTGLPPLPQSIFEKALTASIAADSTGTGLGTINWKLADLPVYLADFIPAGQTITLTYEVTVTDSQGATAKQDITVTITGNDAPSVVWIATTTTGAPPGGLWSDGLNWETGSVPTANDDVIIITNQLIGLTPSYPVTIDAVAEANSLRMDNYGTSGPILINQSTLTISGDLIMADHGIRDPNSNVKYTAPELDNLGTLTVGGAFEMSDDTIVHNSGTISVGGLMKVLNTSVLLNSGTLTLEGGGAFGAASTITNTGTGLIEISGGTLDVQVDIANDGQIKIDPNAILELGSATVDGGVVTNNGTVDMIGAAVLKNGTLAGSGQINVSGFGNTWDNESVTTKDLTILPAGTLTIDQGSMVTNAGTIYLDDGGAGLGRMTLNDATIDGGSIMNSGVINLTGGGVLENGTLWDFNSLLVSGLGNALHDETVSVGGVMEVLPGGALTIDQDTSVANSGGTITVDGTATLNDATVTAGTITNTTKGAIDLTGTAALQNGTLGNAGQINVSGASNALDNERVTNTGAIEIFALGALTLDKLTTVANAGGSLTIDGDGTLALGGATISGGTITDNGAIHVTGASEIDGNAALDNGTVTVDAVLTLDDATVSATTINDHAGIELGGNVELSGGASIQGTSSAELGTITNNGTLEVAGNATLLDDALTNSSGSVIQVDDGATLTLSGVHITGGAINDGSADGASGNIDIAADSTFSDTTLNYGHVTIEGGATLTLDDGATISGGTLTIDGSGILDVVYGTAGAAVTLDGSVINAGLLEATSGGTLQIDGNVSNSGTIEANGGTVVVGANASVSGAAAFTTVTITNGGLAHFIGSSTQALDLNATFSGSGISGTGTLELDNSQHYGGTVIGFGAGDTIDLTDLTYSSSETDIWNSTTHTLTISDGTHSSHIIFSGSYDQNSFALTSDGHGGTDVVMSPAQGSVTGLDSASNAVEGFAAGATLTSATAVSYQWLAGGVAIPGATDASYAPLAGDLGKVLDVVLGFTDHGTAEQVTALAGTVAAPPAVAINADNTTIDENASLTLSGLKASFDDAGNDSFTVKLDVIHGTLALESMAGVIESGSGACLILTGTLTDIDNVLHSGLVYTPTTGYYGSDTLTFEAHDGVFTSNMATASIDVAAAVAGGGTLEFSSAIASDQAVAFQGSTGSLILDAPTSFTGVISGFTGNGTLSGSDQIDLKGIDYNSRSFTESYDATHDTLSVSDGTNSTVLHLNGIYQAANFSFTTDGAGGTIVYDPPVANNPGAKAEAVTATNHGFVFNFADNGNATANANHPVADTHWSDGPLFANAEAILNKLHDDSHGNAAAPPDSHEALTAAAIKAQWHAHDFHFV
jgi:fibronectin-binding autotransporter adhesin